ncbi:MAG: mandelate racemase [Planctomycetes bacterium]|nr:mandelate racemase [Planctomycetota bacterium]
MRTDPLQFRICGIEFRLSEAWTRMPFRYGNASLTAVPILHVRMAVETASGRRAEGFSADGLPPRWFDKDPSKDFERNVADLLAAIQAAREVYSQAGSAGERPAAAYPVWQRAYPEVLRRVSALGLNRLTASFGSSLLERAAIDAACRLAGASFHQALKSGALGFPAGPEIPERPLEKIYCRHTVGLADPIIAAEISPSERLDDGLPQALEEDVRFYGLKYFKVKISNQLDSDLERLRKIAAVLIGQRGEDFHLTLDGNEQYKTAGDLLALLEALGKTAWGRRLLDRTLFIEQPLAREIALLPEARSAIEELGKIRPVLIDESDDDLQAFAKAAELGYRGCSIKNCKGIFKALHNRARVFRWNQELGEDRYFLSGEDLANLPVMPLQQDLATLASLGIPHAERNGHHYFFGLAHLGAAERESALSCHPDLYERRAGQVFLRIRAGRIQCGSLQGPGYGYACKIAFAERVPLEEWRLERLMVQSKSQE